MKILLQLTDLIEDKEEYIKSSKIVEDNGNIFFDFVFNSELNEDEQMKLAECLGNSLAENIKLNELLKNGFGIRVIKECRLCGETLKYDCNGSVAPDDEEWLECEKCGRYYNIDGSIIEEDE